MKTAIIGLGNIGARVAKNLVDGGESIILAARDETKARALAKTLGRNAEVGSIDEAIKRMSSFSMSGLKPSRSSSAHTARRWSEKSSSIPPIRSPQAAKANSRRSSRPTSPQVRSSRDCFPRVPSSSKPLARPAPSLSKAEQIANSSRQCFSMRRTIRTRRGGREIE
jgi:hypothetical protein